MPDAERIVVRHPTAREADGHYPGGPQRQDPELWADELIVFTHDSPAADRLAGVRLDVGNLPPGTVAAVDPDAVMARAAVYERTHGRWPARLDVADLVHPRPVQGA
jgi:hypothetical protein